MRIIINVDEELGEKIESAAEKLNIKKGDWVKLACTDYLSSPEMTENKKSNDSVIDNEKELSVKTLKQEIAALKEEVELQKDLRSTYSKLISEKDQRIEDLKESISRIEAMSITTTDQISSSKDERISDLTQMIDHLQAQAAAHSVALQSAIKPALESKNAEYRSNSDENPDLIEKPKWMFWK
ncbi:MAG: hypothetical protein PHV39_02090 [Methanomicrobium sp.]|nr:hypothetical protein [Methanomicrobium sp.]